MHKSKLYSIIVFSLLLVSACSTTKHVGEEQYLLNNVKIKTEGKGLNTSGLDYYLRQKPNSNFLIFGKIRLKAYNISLMRKLLPKFVQKPVIYSPRLTQTSADQLQLEISNRGYLRAVVDTTILLKNKKAEVKYTIHPGEPYRIRSFKNDINDSTIHQIAARLSKNTTVKPGALFDLAMLDNEKTRLNQMVRNLGYYNFNKDYFYYKADTTVGSHQVDLFLSLYPAPDSLPHKRYKINQVTLLSGYDPADENNKKNFRQADTLSYKGVQIIYGKDHFLRPSALVKNNFIRPGKWYSDRSVNNTLSSYGGVGAIKQTNITFSDTLIGDSTYLNARIALPRANNHWFQTGLDGTNSAGDLGIAGNISYRHQNLFNGAEVLGIKLKGAYEFVSGTKSYDLTSQNYYEYGVETSLTFPQILFPFLSGKVEDKPMSSTQFGIGFTSQKRPEYNRQFFNGNINYKWNSYNIGLSHSLDVINVNYVRMPWVSNTFRETYLENSSYPLLKYSYEDQLIASTTYTAVYVGKRRFNSANTFTLRGGIELAGYLPRLLGWAKATTKSDDGSMKLLGVRYAEFMKTDLDFAKADKLSNDMTLAYHAAIGVAKPYGNSTILPFEKRYFSGGSNSVRGWGTRRLGPGFYHPAKDSVEFANQVGDIKLDLSIELRQKLTSMFQLAYFVDAGNNWVIDNNKNTPEGGLFKFSTFYKQIALSYGLGLRLDLGFLLLRLDGGIKAYDPGQDADRRWRFAHYNLGDDFSLHFAIGYPF